MTDFAAQQIADTFLLANLNRINAHHQLLMEQKHRQPCTRR